MSTAAVKRQLRSLLGAGIFKVSTQKNEMSRNDLFAQLAADPRVQDALKSLYESLSEVCPDNENCYSKRDPSVGDVWYTVKNWHSMPIDKQKPIRQFIETLIQSAPFSKLSQSGRKNTAILRQRFGIPTPSNFTEPKPLHGGESYIGQPTPSDTGNRHEIQKIGNAIIPSNLSEEMGKGEMQPSTAHPDVFMENQSLPTEISIHESAASDRATLTPRYAITHTTQVKPTSEITDTKAMVYQATAGTANLKTSQPNKLGHVESKHVQFQPQQNTQIKSYNILRSKEENMIRAADSQGSTKTGTFTSSGQQQLNTTAYSAGGMGTGGRTTMGGQPDMNPTHTTGGNFNTTRSGADGQPAIGDASMIETSSKSQQPSRVAAMAGAAILASNPSAMQSVSDLLKTFITGVGSAAELIISDVSNLFSDAARTGASLTSDTIGKLEEVVNKLAPTQKDQLNETLNQHFGTTGGFTEVATNVRTAPRKPLKLQGFLGNFADTINNSGPSTNRDQHLINRLNHPFMPAYKDPNEHETLEPGDRVNPLQPEFTETSAMTNGISSSTSAPSSTEARIPFKPSPPATSTQPPWFDPLPAIPPEESSAFTNPNKKGKFEEGRKHAREVNEEDLPEELSPQVKTINDKDTEFTGEFSDVEGVTHLDEQDKLFLKKLWLQRNDLIRNLKNRASTKSKGKEKKIIGKKSYKIYNEKNEQLRKQFKEFIKKKNIKPPSNMTTEGYTTRFFPPAPHEPTAPERTPDLSTGWNPPPPPPIPQTPSDQFNIGRRTETSEESTRPTLRQPPPSRPNVRYQPRDKRPAQPTGPTSEQYDIRIPPSGPEPEALPPLTTSSSSTSSSSGLPPVTGADAVEQPRINTPSATEPERPVHVATQREREFERQVQQLKKETEILQKDRDEQKRRESRDLANIGLQIRRQEKAIKDLSNESTESKQQAESRRRAAAELHRLQDEYAKQRETFRREERQRNEQIRMDIDRTAKMIRDEQIMHNPGGNVPPISFRPSKSARSGARDVNMTEAPQAGGAEGIAPGAGGAAMDVEQQNPEDYIDQYLENKIHGGEANAREEFRNKFPNANIDDILRQYGAENVIEAENKMEDKNELLPPGWDPTQLVEHPSEPMQGKPNVYTPYMRLMMPEGNANIVLQVNQSEEAQKINRYGWQDFNNYQWEANEEQDNPLHLLNIIDETRRFYDPLDKDEYIEDQAQLATEETYHQCNDVCTVPERALLDGDSIILDTRGDSNLRPFTEDETETVFHDTYFPPWIEVPEASAWNKFTAVEGSQIYDSMLEDPNRYTSRDNMALQFQNNFIVSTQN